MISDDFFLFEVDPEQDHCEIFKQMSWFDECYQNVLRKRPVHAFFSRFSGLDNKTLKK